MKKIVLSIMLLMFFFPSAIEANTENPSIKDCLEENGECEELENPTSIKVDQSNDMLLENDGDNSTSFFFNFIKMIFALILILALMYLILVFLKRKNHLQSQSGNIQNLGGLNVGANKSIQIVKIGSKVYVVGVGEDVQLLEQITDETTIDQLETEAAEKLDPTNIFQTFLRKKGESEVQVGQSFQTELMQWSKKRQQILSNKKVKDDSNE